MRNYSILIAILCSFGSEAQTFNGGTGPILDLQTIDIPIPVSGLTPTSINTTSFGLEEICLDVTHTYLADLTAWIIAPDGTTIQLFSGIGGGNNNLQGTCLRADAGTAIGAGTAPFTGTFKPMGQIGLVNNNQNPNGTWILRINDAYNQDEGTLNSCSITFGNTPATFFQLTESDLPIVIISTNGQTIVDEPKIDAHMGIIYNGPGMRNYTSDPLNGYDGNIGIEIRGNYSASLPQKPYTIELRDGLGVQFDASILGMPAEHDWLLIANYNDKSFARNILSYELFDDMGHYAPRHKLVDVIINNEYKGIYLLCEKIKRDANRVDIANLSPNEIFPPDISGGYILKFDYWDASNSWLSNFHPIDHPNYNVHPVYVYPKPQDIAPEQKVYIQGFINDFETALYSSDFADPTIGFRKYLSIRSWLDYFIVNELARNGDGFKKSWYVYKEKDFPDGTLGKLKSGPVWDFDWAWKDMWDCMYNQTDGSAWAYQVNDCNPDVKSNGWYVRMLQDTLFQNELRCRYEDLRRNLLSQEHLHAMVDSVALYVNESQAWHYDTWGNMGVATGTPEVPAPSQSYAEEVQRLKDWIDRRLDWLDLNIPGTLEGCSMTGLEDNDDISNSEVYPNPFSDQLTVRIDETRSQSVVLRILDASGRCVYSENFDEQQNGIYTIKGLDHIAGGIYTLEMIDGSRRSSKKIVKTSSGITTIK